MTNSNRIKIKIGDAEFEAEGSEQSVQAQYEQFLLLIKDSPHKQFATPGDKSNGDVALQRHERVAFDAALEPGIFELRQDGVVALKMLPNGKDKEADALLLILLGYRRLKNEEQVLATHLLRAAQISGIEIYRPANALSAYDQLIIRGGRRKGSTYRLNNQGIRKAEEIATKIFE